MVKRCFFNITIGGEDQGRIIFELWDEVLRLHLTRAGEAPAPSGRRGAFNRRESLLRPARDMPSVRYTLNPQP